MKMSGGSPLAISAEVLLKSKSGRSLASPETTVTAESVGDFLPAAETISEATRHFRNLGFTVVPSDVTLTLVGMPALFEGVFRVKLEIKKAEPDSGTGVKVHVEGEPVIPHPLRRFVDRIVFPEPPELFI
jgi:hypothetical protein